VRTRRRRSGAMSRLPREARDGLMRAWLEILRERHPGVNWLPAEQEVQEPATRAAAIKRDHAATPLMR
jgi:hypothetical protein